MVPWGFVGVAAALMFVSSWCEELFGECEVDPFPVGPIPLAIKYYVDALVGEGAPAIKWGSAALVLGLYFAYKIYTAPGVPPARPSVSGSKTTTH